MRSPKYNLLLASTNALKHIRHSNVLSSSLLPNYSNFKKKSHTHPISRRNRRAQKSLKASVRLRVGVCRVLCQFLCQQHTTPARDVWRCTGHTVTSAPRVHTSRTNNTLLTQLAYTGYSVPEHITKKNMQCVRRLGCVLRTWWITGIALLNLVCRWNMKPIFRKVVHNIHRSRNDGFFVCVFVAPVARCICLTKGPSFIAPVCMYVCMINIQLYVAVAGRWHHIHFNWFIKVCCFGGPFCCGGNRHATYGKSSVQETCTDLFHVAHDLIYSRIR